MPEYIEKKALIDAIYADGNLGAYAEYIINRVPAADVQPVRWIPVTERLPEEYDDVLIYGERTGASGAKYRELWLTDLKGFLLQGYKPIAWMPLPEPPKEETE